MFTKGIAAGVVIAVLSPGLAAASTSGLTVKPQTAFINERHTGIHVACAPQPTDAFGTTPASCAAVLSLTVPNKDLRDPTFDTGTAIAKARVSIPTASDSVVTLVVKRRYAARFAKQRFKLTTTPVATTTAADGRPLKEPVGSHVTLSSSPV